LLAGIVKEPELADAMAVGVELDAVAAVSIGSRGLLSVQANALKLPFADEAFDVAISTLFVHHLDPAKAIEFLRELGRVARRIYVVDLNRAPLPYYLYRLVAPIFFQRFTVEDGALSILRAYTPDELRDLASAAGLCSVEVRKSSLNRLVLSAGNSPDE
jgi:ubiquinone/menaquinone biosynthesis C-methylase UbiE